MMIKFSPQLNDYESINYSFSGETITAQCGDAIDTFDFTNLPDGFLDPWDVETELPYDVIVSAKRENGVLYVELLNFIKMNATADEVIPTWKEVI